MNDLKARQLIRDIPDFPKPGIVFKDITPVLADPQATREVMDRLAEVVRPMQADLVAGIESRGFIFGAALAFELGMGFVPVRKPGKLPWECIREEYALEYGVNAVEMHSDAVRPGQRVVVVDDLLATGGTAAAACRLIERLGGAVCGCVFVIELGFLDGRAALGARPVTSLICLD